MNAALSDSFMSMIGKGLALLVILTLIMLSVIGVAQYLKINDSINKDIIAPKVTMNAPEYKPGKTLSTAKIEELKINNEKLESFINSLNSICNQYSSK